VNSYEYSKLKFICENKENYIIKYDKKTQFGKIMKYVGIGCIFLCLVYLVWKARSFYLKDERLKAKYKIGEAHQEKKEIKK